MALLDRENVLQLSVLVGTVLEEVLDLVYLLSHLHHPEVVDLLGCLDGSPLQVFSEVDDHRMERQGKKHIFFQSVINLLNNKTMLLGIILSEHQSTCFKLNLLL